MYTLYTYHRIFLSCHTFEQKQVHAIAFTHTKNCPDNSVIVPVQVWGSRGGGLNV